MVFKDSTFSQQLFTAKRFCRNISERLLREVQWCFAAVFPKIVIIFFGRNRPNNKLLDAANKETKKSCGTVVKIHVLWLRAISLYLEGKGRHLALALFAIMVILK